MGRKQHKPISQEQVDRSALAGIHKMAEAMKDMAMAMGQRVSIEREQLKIQEAQLRVSEESLKVQKLLAQQSAVYEAMLNGEADSADET